MAEKHDAEQDEISLLDIYEFFRDGWKTLIGFTLLGLFAGLITAFVLPEKFQASALIEPASVASKGVESVSVLVEKMKSPTYYSPETIGACDLDNQINPAKLLLIDSSQLFLETHLMHRFLIYLNPRLMQQNV